MHVPSEERKRGTVSHTEIVPCSAALVQIVGYPCTIEEACITALTGIPLRQRAVRSRVEL